MGNTYTYKPSSTSSSPPERKSNSGSGKNRIYQIFKRTFELDELSLPAAEGAETNKLESVASLQYPLIKINDYIVNPDEIDMVEIDSTGFLPSITLKCTFIHKTFVSREMPKDGDIISVAIRNKSDLLKSIRNDYVITGIVSSSNPTQLTAPSSITFFGILFIPGLASAAINFSHEGTSLEALKELARTIGLGFATNEDNTDDKQIWISGNEAYDTFIFNVVERAYRDDTSFYNVWIDIYYNLNFVNVNKLLLSSEDEVDSAALLNNIDKDYTYGENSNQSQTIESPKVFSNYDRFKTSSFYISSWKPDNKSTNITFELGTKIYCNLFEHNQKLYDNEDSQKYWDIPVEPTYDKNKVNKYILLRGRATQQSDLKGKDLTRANYNYTEIYAKNKWVGIQYTISNSDDDVMKWDGNHHKNYHRAKIQNLINNKELEKLNVEIKVNGVNMNIIKGDKTPIVLISSDVVENKMIDKESENLDRLEQFYSGWYLVKGFRLKYNKDNDQSVLSNFTQQFILTRREWPPPIAVEALKNQNNT